MLASTWEIANQNSPHSKTITDICHIFTDSTMRSKFTPISFYLLNTMHTVEVTLQILLWSTCEWMLNREWRKCHSNGTFCNWTWHLTTSGDFAKWMWLSDKELDKNKQINKKFLPATAVCCPAIGTCEGDRKCLEWIQKTWRQQLPCQHSMLPCLWSLKSKPHTLPNAGDSGPWMCIWVAYHP